MNISGRIKTICFIIATKLKNIKEKMKNIKKNNDQQKIKKGFITHNLNYLNFFLFTF